MQNRFNTCPEIAITKASERLFPGAHISFNQQANNDAQCDLSTLFAKIPGQDFVIANPGLGGQTAAVNKANTDAMTRVRNESGLYRGNGEAESLEEQITRMADDNDFEALIRRLEQPDILEERAKFERYKAENLAKIVAPMHQILANELQQLTPPNVYMLRTGTVGIGSGHFHTIYYDAPNWILDSGYKDGLPNKGVLYNPHTRELGPMADTLADLSNTWGLAQGQRMLGIYEMNPIRTLVAARYIEKFRELPTEETDLIFPEAFINDIIAQPDYLSTFGKQGYWQAQRNGQHFPLPVVSPSEYIRIALEQCRTQDLAGAVTQLQSKGFFNDPNQGRALLNEMLANNKLDVVREILNKNLVDLSNPAHARALYRSALQFSEQNPDYPPGLNHSLRALQIKLLDVLEYNELPFTIEDASEALNTEALTAMLVLAPIVDYEDLTARVKTGAQQCGAAPGTFNPVLKVIHDHEALSISSGHAKTKPVAQAQKAKSNASKSPIRKSSALSSLKDELIKLDKNTKHDSPDMVWKKACLALKKSANYVCAPADAAKRGARPIKYQAEAPNGKIITKIVSEKEQILLDKLLAKKLENEYNSSPSGLRR